MSYTKKYFNLIFSLKKMLLHDHDFLTWAVFGTGSVSCYRFVKVFRIMGLASR